MVIGGLGPPSSLSRRLPFGRSRRRSCRRWRAAAFVRSKIHVYLQPKQYCLFDDQLVKMCVFLLALSKRVEPSNIYNSDLQPTAYHGLHPELYKYINRTTKLRLSFLRNAVSLIVFGKRFILIAVSTRIVALCERALPCTKGIIPITLTRQRRFS